MIYTKFTADQFKAYTGKLLDSRLPGEDDETNKVERFINICTDDIKDYILDNDYGHIDFANLSETQNDIINRAAMMHADYILENSDFRNASGFDGVTGVFADFNEVKKRLIAPKAKSLLLSRIICRSR